MSITTMNGHAPAVARNGVLDAALAYHRAGLPVLPNDPDRKYPRGLEGWQTFVASETDIRRWFGGTTRHAIGIRTGNGIEGLDFDEKYNQDTSETLFDRWRTLVDALAPGLVDRLTIETSPTDGRHALYRCETVAGNSKLATRPPTPEEIASNPKSREVTLIETRGTGGQFMAAPNTGYRLVQGTWCDLPTISPAERTILLDCARALSLGSLDTQKQIGQAAQRGGRVGDDFNARGHDAALDSLVRAGWTIARQHGGTTYLTRPGKHPRDGISASVGHVAPGVLFVFSSNASPFDVEHAYDPFGVVARLDYNGDFAAATRGLVAHGYGESALPRNGNRRVDPETGEILEPGTPQPWDAPLSLDTRHTLPAFPVDALPAWLASYVAAVSESTQTPPDLAGIVVLAALATTAHQTYQVWVKDAWIEPVNLYALVASEPGTRKSAVFGLATRPIRQWEKERVDAMESDILNKQDELDMLTARRDSRKKEAGKGDATKRAIILEELQTLNSEIADFVMPHAPTLIADDATPEALSNLIATHGAIAVLTPEGGIFDQIAGRYSDKPNYEIYLKGHVGEFHSVHRMSGRVERIERAIMTIGATIQPGVLLGLAARPGFRDRGLLGRFLYSLPVDLVGYRQSPDVVPPIPPSVQAEYAAGLVRILAMPPAYSASGDATAWPLSLAPDAARAFFAYERHIEPQLRPGAALAHIRDWASKHCGAVARIAGLLHVASCAAPETTPITLDTIRRAIRLGEYFVAHALAAFDAMGADAELGNARALLAWLARYGAATCTKRDIFEGNRARFRTATAIDGPIGILEAHGYIRRVPLDADRGRGRPSERFEIYPAIGSQNTQNTQKSPETVNNANIAYFANIAGASASENHTAPVDEPSVERRTVESVETLSESSTVDDGAPISADGGGDAPPTTGGTSDLTPDEDAAHVAVRALIGKSERGRKHALLGWHTNDDRLFTVFAEMNNVAPDLLALALRNDACGKALFTRT